MLSCTGKRSHRHTILHVSFSNSFGLASARPTPQGLSGAPQLSLKNLTVTGYINGRDIKFIQNLMQNENKSLVHIDLTDATIVAGEGSKDNIVHYNYFFLKR